MIKWGSPKIYQKDRGEDRLIPSRLWRKKYKCKKLKGEHEFGKWKEHIWSWSKKEHSGFWERFCKGCNKKDTWLAPSLPGPFWRLDLDARPPDYVPEGDI